MAQDVYNLLAACGIGAARLTLTVEESEHPRGANIHGKLMVAGGAVPQRIERLTVSLVEYLPNKSNVIAQSLVHQLTVLADSLTEFAYCLEVPNDARLSMPPARATCVTKIVAVAEIPWSVHPRVTVPANIAPHREIIAVHRAMMALGFRQRDAGGLTVVSDSFAEGFWHAVVYRYDPPSSLRDRLNMVKLELGVDAGVLIAHVSIHHRGHNLKETLSGLAGGNVDSSALEIPCRELRDSEGKPRPDGAKGRLEEMLSKALADQDDVLYSLLRSSSSPGSTPDHLLRPATHVRTVRDDELLRTIDDGQNHSGKDLR